MTEKTDILIDEVLKEMDRVWGKEGFEGKDKEYEWLLENYGISEYEDVKWQLLLLKSVNDLPEEEDDDDDPEMREFLDDDELIYAFLEETLAKYRSSSAAYPKG